MILRLSPTALVAEALEAARQLEQEGVSAAVIDMFTLKPIDRMLVKNYVRKNAQGVSSRVKTTASIRTGISGGGRVENCSVPMRRVGVKERYGQVGTQDLQQECRTHRRSAIVEAAKSLL
ncbi:hypothetical protein KCP77_09945 [Salmonella enterica subsp. enterica]|nr:hypothetical protein KCP77_09945 [Salmonella enterica subsp. enterica]